MTGWNLPPGCEVHHIPGNRPEDELWDRLLESPLEYQDGYSAGVEGINWTGFRGSPLSVLGWIDALKAEADEIAYLNSLEEQIADEQMTFIYEDDALDGYSRRDPSTGAVL